MEGELQMGPKKPTQDAECRFKPWDMLALIPSQVVNQYTQNA